MVSKDTETENCKHLENQTVAREFKYGFRDNATMKNSNKNLAGGDLWFSGSYRGQ
jgi:hypothetical protein